MIARTLFLALALTGQAVAQTPPTPTEIDGRLQWLASQRDEASNQAAMLAGRLNDTLAKLKAATEEVDRLKKACGDACEAKPKKEKGK